MMERSHSVLVVCGCQLSGMVIVVRSWLGFNRLEMVTHASSTFSGAWNRIMGIGVI